jgi:hypothetical protein
LKVIQIQSINNWQELFHVEKKHLMSAIVLLSEVQSQVSRRMKFSTKKTSAAQELQESRILPCVFKLPMHQGLFQPIPQIMLQ